MLGVIKENINLIFADYTQIKDVSRIFVDLYGSGGKRPF